MPSYQLMAVVVVVIIAVTAPLVFMQRLLLRQTQRYVSVRGKGLKTQPLRLHGWRWFAFGVIVFWLFVTVVVPLFGITLRSFVVTWGEGVKLLDVLTLDHYRELPNIRMSSAASSIRSASALLAARSRSHATPLSRLRYIAGIRAGPGWSTIL